MTGPADLELACQLGEAVRTQNSRAGNNRTYHMVISLHPEDRSLNGNELRRVVENLVVTLGFSGHQYIAARHNDKDHEHVHGAINKIHPETFSDSETSGPRSRISWKLQELRPGGTPPSRPSRRRACGRNTSSLSTKPVDSASRRGAATETPPLASVGALVSGFSQA